MGEEKSASKTAGPRRLLWVRSEGAPAACTHLVAGLNVTVRADPELQDRAGFCFFGDRDLLFLML